MGYSDVIKWRQQIPGEDGNPLTAELSVATHLFMACSSLFHDILAVFTQEQSIEQLTLSSLYRSRSYLKLWADGCGVGEGLMDFSLSKSKRARTTTHLLLLRISSTLEES